MDRHFALPVTIAAALHAGLLFGIPKQPHAAVTDVRVPSLRPEQLLIVPEPVTADPSEEKADAAASKDLRPPPPTQPERPPTQPTEFEIKIPHQPPGRIDNGKLDFEIHPPGSGLGDKNGVGIDDVIPSRWLDATPRTRLQVPPQYPREQRSNGIEGEVVVEFTVDESGSVLAPHVVRSTDRAFDEATLRAVAKWRFEPGKRDGRVVRFRMAVPVIFKLDHN